MVLSGVRSFSFLPFLPFFPFFYTREVCYRMLDSSEHYTIQVLIYETLSELVDSLCRDGAGLPRAPYIGKACTHLNGESLSLFRGPTMVLK